MIFNLEPNMSNLNWVLEKDSITGADIYKIEKNNEPEK